MKKPYELKCLSGTKISGGFGGPQKLENHIVNWKKRFSSIKNAKEYIRKNYSDDLIFGNEWRRKEEHLICYGKYNTKYTIIKVK